MSDVKKLQAKADKKLLKALEDRERVLRAICNVYSDVHPETHARLWAELQLVKGAIAECTQRIAG